jgi:hypothetical protein
VQVLRATSPDEAGIVAGAACRMAFTAGLAVAVLLSQRMIGAKKWVK